MERGTTLFLKAAVILIGIPVLALCIFVVPEIANFIAELYPGHTYLKYLVYIDLYAAAIPFYFALYQALLLLEAICKALDCQPGDLLEYKSGEDATLIG